MQDRAVVAAVIAADADGFGAAYDRYAASLYARCHAVLKEPSAAEEAVLDTFLVAAARLDGLRDPDRLGPWLHAVARNECRRRLASGGEMPRPADLGAEPPELPPPPGLRGRVLAACADNSPAGRAHRMSVAHRAGEFGPAGFPKAIGPSGPAWWRRVRRHPGVVTAVAVVAALAVTAGITAAMTAGASHRPQASGDDPGLGPPGAAGDGARGRGHRGAAAGPRHLRALPVALPVTLRVHLARPGIPDGEAGPAGAHVGERAAGQRVLRAHRG